MEVVAHSMYWSLSMYVLYVHTVCTHVCRHSSYGCYYIRTPYARSLSMYVCVFIVSPAMDAVIHCVHWSLSMYVCVFVDSPAENAFCDLYSTFVYILYVCNTCVHMYRFYVCTLVCMYSKQYVCTVRTIHLSPFIDLPVVEVYSVGRYVCR